MRDDWTGTRRRRWSAPRAAAAVLLQLLALGGLLRAIDRVQVPSHARERLSTLVDVALQVAPPPPARPRPPLPVLAPARAPARDHATAPAREPAPAVDVPPAPPSIAISAPPVASAPRPDRSFLDNAATRQAIRDVARGSLQTRAGELTREAPGSELVAADGSHVGDTRHVTPTPAQRLEQGVDAAHKHDCMKGDFLGAGMGLLSAPFLLANEALGNCAHKL